MSLNIQFALRSALFDMCKIGNSYMYTLRKRVQGGTYTLFIKKNKKTQENILRTQVVDKK